MSGSREVKARGTCMYRVKLESPKPAVHQKVYGERTFGGIETEKTLVEMAAYYEWRPLQKKCCKALDFIIESHNLRISAALEANPLIYCYHDASSGMSKHSNVYKVRHVPRLQMLQLAKACW